MGCKLDLLPSSRGAGYATLRVSSWRGKAAPTELCIARNSDHYYLNQDGTWAPQENWLPLPTPQSESQAGNGAIEYEINPTEVDSLAASSTLRYLVQLKSSDHQDRSVMNIDPQIITSFASKPEAAVEEPEQPVQPEEPAEKAPQIPEPEPEPEPEPPPVKAEPASPQAISEPGGSRRLMLLTVALVLLVAAGAAWWWFSHAQEDQSELASEQTEQTEESEQTEQSELTEQTDATSTGPGPAPPAPAIPCDLASSGDQDDLAFIQSCLASQPETRKLKQVLQTAEQEGRCEMAHRLYVHQARGNAEIAAQFASRHHPGSFIQGGCVEQPDLETAGYWYRRALELDEDNPVLKRALGSTLTELHSAGREFDEGMQLLEQAAESGDEIAKELLGNKG